MTPGEIAKLVKSLRRNCTHVTCGCDYHRAADAIERLSSPVLPEEVANVVESLNVDGHRLAARPLQRLASRQNDLMVMLASRNEEIDRLRAELAECKTQNRAMAETMSGLAKLDAKEG
jgi:hypothetical protein